MDPTPPLRARKGPAVHHMQQSQAAQQQNASTSGGIPTSPILAAAAAHYSIGDSPAHNSSTYNVTLGGNHPAPPPPFSLAGSLHEQQQQHQYEGQGMGSMDHSSGGMGTTNSTELMVLNRTGSHLHDANDVSNRSRSGSARGHTPIPTSTPPKAVTVVPPSSMTEDDHQHHHHTGHLIPEEIPSSPLLYVLTTSEGRDKLFKTLQYLLKSIIVILNIKDLFPSGAQEFLKYWSARLSTNITTIRNGRALFKICRWIVTLFHLASIIQRLKNKHFPSERLEQQKGPGAKQRTQDWFSAIGYYVPTGISITRVLQLSQGGVPTVRRTVVPAGRHSHRSSPNGLRSRLHREGSPVDSLAYTYSVATIGDDCDESTFFESEPTPARTPNDEVQNSSMISHPHSTASGANGAGASVTTCHERTWSTGSGATGGRRGRRVVEFPEEPPADMGDSHSTSTPVALSLLTPPDALPEHPAAVATPKTTTELVLVPSTYAKPSLHRKDPEDFSSPLMVLLGLRAVASISRNILRDTLFLSNKEMLGMGFSAAKDTVAAKKYGLMRKGEGGFLAAVSHLVAMIVPLEKLTTKEGIHSLQMWANRFWFAVSCIDLALNTHRLLNREWLRQSMTGDSKLVCSCNIGDLQAEAQMLENGNKKETANTPFLRRKQNLFFPALDQDFGCPSTHTPKFLEAAEPGTMHMSCNICGCCCLIKPKLVSDSSAGANDGAVTTTKRDSQWQVMLVPWLLRKGYSMVWTLTTHENLKHTCLLQVKYLCDTYMSYAYTFSDYEPPAEMDERAVVQHLHPLGSACGLLGSVIALWRVYISGCS